MKPVRYVIMNPSGNLTALVTEWGGAGEEPEITRRLMRKSEQVAYLEAPELPGALARVRLMGGEFCGNAAMAAAGWAARDRIRPGETITVPMEVSGAEGLVFCFLKGLEEGFEGTVEMPRVLSLRPEKLCGCVFTAVRMEGIIHLIREEREPLEKEAAEKLLLQLAEKLPEEAVGLLDRSPETGFMKPLVYVRGSGTMVWETACGSGSAAVGAVRALRHPGETVYTDVLQPGGMIRTAARAENEKVQTVRITGTVRWGSEQTLPPEDK